ncbi:GTPase-activating Rap/Ran-GAP domain-like protein 3 [Lamellibrachia satsuma]|nr:GTPase-activating Rap/Ran-GAP domain-like protein 3 [Lamellibrachia satsuma]
MLAESFLFRLTSFLGRRVSGDKTRTRLNLFNIFSEESVPLFGPPLPSPPVFLNHQQFRDFLLVKLINGEKAAFNTPVFANKRRRTLEMLIRSIYQEHMPENSKNNMLNRRAFSDLIPENVHGSRRKEEARQLEFVRVGQSLKLKTILKGDAPTSLATSGALLKQQPWEPQCFLLDFPYDIICGDSWGDKLVVATSSGVFVLEEGTAPRIIFDKSVSVKQLNVVEAHGLLIFLADKGKESRVCMFRLTDFEGEEQESVVLNKSDCKEHKLEKTKGCHLYATSRPGGSHLRMVISVGKRLLVYAWKHSSAWSAWCSVADDDITEELQFVRELQAFEVPQLMTLVDAVGDVNQICIAYKNQFDLINEKNGDTLQLYQIDANKVNIVSAIDIYEDDEAELLLCYNHISHFQKLSEESSHEFDFHWNSQPKAIVCAFPYIMAFTPDTIEIRLIINGSLVHTMTIPELFLVTSKCDIYFGSTAPDVGPLSSPTTKEFTFSPPASPSVLSMKASPTVNLYKIPLTCLAGQMSSEKPITCPQMALPQTLLAPLVSVPEQTHIKSTQHSPLVRTKRLSPATPLPVEDIQNRHYSNSSSSDSGILLNRNLSETSPPVSPFFSTSLDDEESAIV